MADESNPIGASPATPEPAGAAASTLPVVSTMDDGASANGGGTADKGTGGSFKDSASAFAKQAADKARDLAADGKARAGDALDEVSRLMGSAADTVDEKLGVDYGKYARSAADGIAGFSESLKGKEIDDLVADVQGFVRKSPAVAIGVAAAVGFVVARLVKAGLDGADGKADDSTDRAEDAADA